MDIYNLNKYIDHTNLKPDANLSDIQTLCQQAMKYCFASVCVNPCHVAYSSSILKDSDVRVCTVTGFPLGSGTSAVKVYETKQAVLDGADEIDTVINIGMIKTGDYNYVRDELSEIRKECRGKILKVIIEACLLTDEEKVKVCRICEDIGADFVKTSTGFSISGADKNDVALMRSSVSDKVGVKAAGGIRTYEQAVEMIESGASRIGTSNGIDIIKKQENL